MQRAFWGAALLPSAEAGVPFATSAAAFVPRGPQAEGEWEELRAGDGLVVTGKSFIEFRRQRTFSA